MFERTSPRGRACLLLVLCVMLATPLLLTGCSDEPEAAVDEPEQAATTDNCVACHTDVDALTDSGLPDEMDAEAFFVSQEFLDSDHAAEGCVACHDGDAMAADKDAAHDGFVVDPSADLATCSGSDCHDDIASTFEGSLHDTASGILQKLELRLSGTPDGKARAQEVFMAEDSCYGCHATCGQCHISQPAMFGGGLLDGHVFTDATDQEYNDVTCAQCHDSIGPMYVERDLHHDLGYSCADCHSNEAEVHGDGETHANIGEGTITEECVDCHDDLEGKAHTPSHLEGASCDACHSAEYTSCLGCHEEDGMPESMEDILKLAQDEDGRIRPVTHMGLSEEMFGEPYLDMDQLATKSSWILQAPHAVQKAMPTQELCDRCHGPATAFLREEDLQFPEVERHLLITEPLPAVSP